MYYIIINPASKSGRGRKIWAELEPIFIERNIPYKAVFSKRAGHVTRLVSKLTGTEQNKTEPVSIHSEPDMAEPASASSAGKTPDGEAPVKLIILGGDGTMNEALQGIRDFDRILLGYIPTGSSNDLARDLKLAKDPAVILETILEGQTVRTMDLGTLTYEQRSEEHSRLSAEEVPVTRYFAVSCGIGFDAAVCEEALASRFKNTLNRLGLGKLTYLVIALRQLIAAKKVSCDIYLEDASEPIHLDRFLFTAFMIHKYEGGGFKFCPTADYKDGRLDLCVVGNISKPLILAALPTAFFGKHYLFSQIRHYTASRVAFRSSVPLWVHTDGEVYIKSDSITVSCTPQKIKLMM